MRKYKYSLHLLLAILSLFFIASCAPAEPVVGKWREIGKTATLEFYEDSTFKAVDNQGMAVSGKYILNKDGDVRFEIDYPASEIVIGKISVKGEELTFISEDGSEVDKYKREK